MGVPMLRPGLDGVSGPSSLRSVDCAASLLALNPAWFDIFRFCGVQDLGACLAADRSWKAVADAHHVWADAYDRTQCVDASSAPNGEGLLRSLIERPFGEDAVGWEVAVLIEDGSERYSTGHIVAYRPEIDSYLVDYGSSSGLPGGDRRWEQERRKRTAAMRHNPSLLGKSRFNFLSPPKPLAATGGSSSSSSLPRLAGCHGSWKQELEHNVCNAPSRLLTRLLEHKDEVLFVVFSPCGTRLASCSRDLRTVIFKVKTTDSTSSSLPGNSDHCAEDCSTANMAGCSSRTRRRAPDPTFEREAVFIHQTAPCRAIWWPIPPYNTVAVSTE
ncbi:unnamed protein product, partial [Polarella glacialis]